ncbi:MAG: GntR family transcriptional regulator [Clostridia bacterium]|nr:GntR family transcriptional regulator [Clostridia bacterium]
MSGIKVDYRDRRPIYEQLVGNVCEMILRGVLQPDEQLPSVRALASELGINPNTIQKAYTELERRGLVYSSPGRGSFVSSDSGKLTEEARAHAMEAFVRAATEVKRTGISREEMLAALEAVWDA